MRILIGAIGKARGLFADLAADYTKRFTLPLTVRELDVRPAVAERESAALLALIPDGAVVVVCDERGQSLGSAAFAEKLGVWRDSGCKDLVFLIGGADGHTEALRKRADLLLCMGQMTWPHQLARVMLIEQLYRAQQILAGHPYHRA